MLELSGQVCVDGGRGEGREGEFKRGKEGEQREGEEERME